MTNRRAFLGKMGATALIGAGALTACNNAQNQITAPTAKGNPDSQAPPNPFAKMTYNFYGTHQAGITTPVQHHVYFLVAELHNTNVDEIRQMFKDWTEYSAKLTQGKNIKPYDKNPHLPPADTGEADSLGAYGLTLTFGISPSFLEKLGLSDKAPPEFSDLPKFPQD